MAIVVRTLAAEVDESGADLYSSVRVGDDEYMEAVQRKTSLLGNDISNTPGNTVPGPVNTTSFLRRRLSASLQDETVKTHSHDDDDGGYEHR